MTFQYRAEIERAAAGYQLDPDLIHALVLCESAGDRYAVRPEAHYRWLWDVKQKRPFRKLLSVEISHVTAPADFPSLAGTGTQEWTMQRMSLGLCQIMGAVAREYGFQEPYLTQMTEPGYNLVIGCTVLAARLRWAEGDVTRGLAAYNAGTGNVKAGLGYAAKVLAECDRVRERRRG